MTSQLPGDDSHLSRIATHLPELRGQDNSEISRYWRAVYCYILNLVRQPEKAEELTGRFLERFVEGRFFKLFDSGKGRFRDYLKSCLRNLVTDYLRAEKKEREHWHPLPADDNLLVSKEQVVMAEENFDSVLGEDCLARAWKGLFQLQERSKTPFATVLEFKSKHPEVRSDAMAAQLNQQLGTDWTGSYLRKILERARDQFAGLLIDEVLKSLPLGEKDRLEEELISTPGIMKALLSRSSLYQVRVSILIAAG